MPRTAVIQIRVSDAEKRAIRTAAAAQGVGLTTFLRRLALERAAEPATTTRPLTSWERYELLLARHRATTGDEGEAVRAAQWELALDWPSDFQRVFARLGLADSGDVGQSDESPA